MPYRQPSLTAAVNVLRRKMGSEKSTIAIIMAINGKRTNASSTIAAPRSLRARPGATTCLTLPRSSRVEAIFSEFPGIYWGRELLNGDIGLRCKEIRGQDLEDSVTTCDARRYLNVDLIQADELRR